MTDMPRPCRFATVHVASLLCALLISWRGAAAGPADPERAQWSQFRGPGSSGVAAGEARFPAQLDRENLAWEREVPAGHSSPVLWGERVFLTGASGSTLETLCIERSSGAVLWRRAIEVDAVERAHPVNGPATPTPATDGERVYAYFGSFGLVCYDVEGNERWRRPLSAQENTFGSAASPVLAGDVLVLNRDTDGESFLEALRPATGETVWRVERDGFRSGWSTPVLLGRDGVDELLVYGAWWLTAYDLADGSVRWSLPGLTDEPCTTPVTGEGLVFLTSYNMKTNPEVVGLPAFGDLVRDYDADGNGTLSFAEIEPNESILSRHDADGEGDHPLTMFFRFLDVDRDGEITAGEWEKIVAWLDGFEFANALLAVRPGGKGADPEIVWQHAHGVPECPSPLYYRGRVYMVKNGGIVTCLDARTGEPKFQGRTGARGPCYASPVAADGKVYAASARGTVAVLEAGDALVVLASSDLGERILATPALADGVVYVRTERALYAFGAE